MGVAATTGVVATGGAGAAAATGVVATGGTGATTTGGSGSSRSPPRANAASVSASSLAASASAAAGAGTTSRPKTDGSRTGGRGPVASPARSASLSAARSDATSMRSASRSAAALAASRRARAPPRARRRRRRGTRRSHFHRRARQSGAASRRRTPSDALPRTRPFRFPRRRSRFLRRRRPSPARGSLARFGRARGRAGDARQRLRRRGLFGPTRGDHRRRLQTVADVDRRTFAESHPASRGRVEPSRQARASFGDARLLAIGRGARRDDARGGVRAARHAPHLAAGERGDALREGLVQGVAVPQRAALARAPRVHARDVGDSIVASLSDDHDRRVELPARDERHGGVFLEYSVGIPIRLADCFRERPRARAPPRPIPRRPHPRRRRGCTARRPPSRRACATCRRRCARREPSPNRGRRARASAASVHLFQAPRRRRSSNPGSSLWTSRGSSSPRQTRPSLPPSASPHAYTSPSATAAVCHRPQDTDVTRFPASASTRVGVARAFRETEISSSSFLFLFAARRSSRRPARRTRSRPR